MSSDTEVASGVGEERALMDRALVDRALVDRARAGDREAVDALVSQHHQAVYRVAYRVLGDPDAAADATQEAFMKAVSALGGFRGDASVRTWLLRIAANTATSAGRRVARRAEVALDDAGAGLSAAGPDPERAAVVRSEVDRVQAALAELPEKQRLAVTLRLEEELSHREAAEVLGSTEGAVRVNYHLGIKRLRERLT